HPRLPRTLASWPPPLPSPSASPRPRAASPSLLFAFRVAIVGVNEEMHAGGGHGRLHERDHRRRGAHGRRRTPRGSGRPRRRGLWTERRGP
uniref:Uncharacterized protein n=1 Tax=Aegilops tauschii subsp. strangulata TaxID=200361 RepID=A0A453H6H4_AEGTS